MTEPVVEPLSEQDLYALRDRSGLPLPLQLMRAQVSSGQAWVAKVDGKILGAAGITIPWPGMGLVWMVAGPGIEAWGLWMTRTVRQWLRRLIIDHQLIRVEALSEAGAVQSHRWLELMGFEPERNGVARKYLPGGRDVKRYEWIR